MRRADLRYDLIRDEGLRLLPYPDSVGKLTIGVGRNIEDRGITRDEAMYMLDTDIDAVVYELDRKFPWWRDLNEPRQRALANMAFNLGLPTLSGFAKMLQALKTQDYDRAADEALDSRWAKQVGQRARRIADTFRTGEG